jgi:hypothetical protein
MMKFNPYLIIFGLILPFAVSAQSVTLNPNVKGAMEQVKPDEIKDDITYLADDKLQGRMPGTEGYQMAVDYVVAHLKALNVKPAGENGTWLQKVRLRKTLVHDAKLNIAYDPLNPLATRSGDDCVVYPNPLFPDVKLNAPLVFVGYGISEPDLNYDDYAGIDVKGKVVVIVKGAPDSFSSSIAAHVANNNTILKTAAQHDAAGVIIASADSTLTVLTGVDKGVYSVMDAQGNVVVSRSYYSDQIKLFATAKFTMLNFLFHNMNKNIQHVKSRQAAIIYF